MLQQDYIMRQIRNLIRFIAKVLLKKDSVEYILDEKEENKKVDLIHKRLLELIELGKLNEAEDLLFAEFDASNLKYLELALDFYARLNDLDDEFLEEKDFSREEIKEGLRDIGKIFGIMI